MPKLKEIFKSHFAYLIIFVSLSFLLYGNTLPGEFLYDDWQFTQRSELYEVENLPEIFLEKGTPQTKVSGYRPLTTVLMGLHLSLVGEKPLTFHTLSVILNSANIFLIFTLILLLFKDVRLAIFSALIFAFFPIHTENVAYIKAQDDLISALFALLSFNIFIYSLNHKKGVLMLWSSAGAFLLSLLSKELNFFMPLAFLLIARIRFQEKWLALVKKSLPFGLAYLIYILLRLKVFGEYAFQPNLNIDFIFNPLISADLTTKILTNFKVFFMYIAKTFVPYNLSAGYQYNHLTLVSNLFSSWEAISGIYLVFVMIFILVYPKLKDHPVRIGLIFFLIPFLLVPRIFIQSGDIFAERWMYLSSMGLAFILAYFLSILYKRWKFISLIFLGFLLSYYGLTIVRRNPVWRNAHTLFTSMVKDAPDNIRSHYSLAVEYYFEGNLIEAAKSAQKAYLIYPAYTPVTHLLGKIAYYEGNYPLAERIMLKVIKEIPGASGPHKVYAKSLMNQGRYQEAVAHIYPAYQVKPHDETYRAIMGISYYHLGQINEAKKYLDWDEKSNQPKMNDLYKELL